MGSDIGLTDLLKSGTTMGIPPSPSPLWEYMTMFKILLLYTRAQRDILSFRHTLPYFAHYDHLTYFSSGTLNLANRPGPRWLGNIMARLLSSFTICEPGLRSRKLSQECRQDCENGQNKLQYPPPPPPPQRQINKYKHEQMHIVWDIP